MSGLLPAEFADLEPFAETWCLATESERYARRLASSMAEMQEFYDAITPRAEDVIAHCDRFPLDDLPDEVRNLLYLLYSMIMVSFPVEVWSQPWIPDASAASLECVVEPIP
ncbi:hypothetical protein BJY24_006265 [Nocardia transvalensis]|uniref:Xaa-Pro dipeptidase n=1 Tax=Nocardia transvalensis TaxID=37333 RepID=A0A7W9PKG7_9NOCA|nr:hypothetical protein [Nocardia transvalensis]MBB5917353.1 hypothetical protein [Nocardia transvalensis]